ncbi:RES family NAD+ phosphorylase [Methylosinus sp. PW1]|uniref:RES family NAD+ phosphorylase n=1 Tax=Methylosinus sp. PW1 TaxID=107636 RepID=UPI00055DF417|nr:RES family NAD+ phosphorylase [Methylosinus sp. PW1]
MILRLRTGSETLILGPRAAFAGLAGRDRRALVSEYEVRRRLRLALADPEGADALRRAFALWREEGARIREADDRALIDRVARMSRNGALAAFVVQDRAKGLGVSTAAAPPVGAKLAGANVTGANVTGMNMQERLTATLRLVPNHLSGTTKQAFAELIEPKALAITVEVLALWAISHAFGAGEAIDAVLLGAGVYFGGAQIWQGLHALFHALDLIRMAQSAAQLDEAAAIFAEGVTRLGVAVLIAALTHGAAKKAARWTEKKPSLRNTPQERAPKAERFEERPARTSSAKRDSTRPIKNDGSASAGAKQDANAYHTTDSSGKAQSIVNGVDPKYLNPKSRFGKAFYVAQEPETALAEVAHHGMSPNAGIRFELDETAMKTLDLTDASTAEAWGYARGPISSKTQEIGELARQKGYNVIKYPSERNAGGTNLAILDDFDQILRPAMITPVRP